MTTTLKHSANPDIPTSVMQTHSHSVLLSDDYSNFVLNKHLCHSKICFPKAFQGTSESGQDANPDSLCLLALDFAVLRLIKASSLFFNQGMPSSEARTLRFEDTEMLRMGCPTYCLLQQKFLPQPPKATVNIFSLFCLKSKYHRWTLQFLLVFWMSREDKDKANGIICIIFINYKFLQLPDKHSNPSLIPNTDGLGGPFSNRGSQAFLNSACVKQVDS